MTLNTSNTRDFIASIVTLVSVFQVDSSRRLTPAEASVLTEILNLPPKHLSFPLTTPARKLLLKTLDITPAAFYTKLYPLIEKGYLKRDEDNVILIAKPLLKLILDALASKSFTLNISLDENKENT